MRWSGPAYRMWSEDDGRQLTIHLQHECRGIDLAMAGIALAGIPVAVVFASKIAAVVCLFLAVILAANAMKSNAMSVSATADGLSSAGRFFPWTNIYRLEHYNGDDYAASALRLRQVSKDTDILSGVERSQAEEIIFMIRRRFPEAPMAANPGPRTALGRWWRRTFGW